MRPVLTAAETQAVDRESEARGVPVIDLMERAGWAVARAALRLAGGAYGARAVVVAHKGNNGGDGLVAARHLAARGVHVSVLLLAEPSAFREPAGTNLRRLEGMRVLQASEPVLERELQRADVVIDAIFGTGFRGPAEGLAARAIEAINASDAPVVAVDIPSGVNGDTGAVPGPAVVAAVTVALGAPKAGDVLYPGAAYAGAIDVVDIGFPPDLVRSDLLLIEPDDVAETLPVRGPEAHKRSTGVVLVVAGSRDMPGAASLVASGAYAGGAGLVRMAVVPDVRPRVAGHLPEVTFLPLPATGEGALGPGAWGVIAAEVGRAQAIAIGPGLSAGDETAAEVRRIVLEAPVPVVADADALNAFVGHRGELSSRASELVLTPHAGEFARLFETSAADLADDRVGLVRKAAAETGCTVLLKGVRTLVGTPDGRVRVNPTGTPALATGGTGDVLTGVIAALLARGMAPDDAAAAGAFVHGLAGQAAGEDAGEGATATDVAARVGPAAASLVGPP